MMKDLFLIRHAESSHPLDVNDFERPLSERGQIEAETMSARFTKHHSLPEFIISSPAKRALSTAMTFAKTLHIPNQRIQFENMIYEARVSSLLSIVNHLPEELNGVALFGHNPSITSFAEYLSGESIGNVPTAGIIHIQFSVTDWKMVSKDLGVIKWKAGPKQ